MPQEKKPGSQQSDTMASPGGGKKSVANKKPVVDKQPAAAKQSSAEPSQMARSQGSPGKGSKSAKSRVGGTATPGAKSTQPREVATTDPQKQQAETYNREMRRRMQHLKTGPYSDAPTPVEQRRKKIERRKKEIDEVRQELRARGPRNITIGRRNTYFLIAVAVLVVLLIVVAVLFPLHIL